MEFHTGDTCEFWEWSFEGQGQTCLYVCSQCVVLISGPFVVCITQITGELFRRPSVHMSRINVRFQPFLFAFFLSSNGTLFSHCNFFHQTCNLINLFVFQFAYQFISVFRFGIGNRPQFLLNVQVMKIKDIQKKAEILI